ncbi:MAG: DUF1617 family protein [Oscillospiraceae bacterium]|jgi:hypothetical protein|nr:DUF1617 family protein [Oscillospiraceae bacterium]
MLKLKNHDLINVAEFLDKVELPPKASRARTKLNRLFITKIGELNNDERELLEKYGKKDESGNLIESNGNFTLIEETAVEFHKEKAALFDEVTSINADELKDKFGTLIDALENSDIKVSGKDAEALDLLLDALEGEVVASEG